MEELTYFVSLACKINMYWEFELIEHTVAFSTLELEGVEFLHVSIQHARVLQWIGVEYCWYLSEELRVQNNLHPIILLLH